MDMGYFKELLLPEASFLVPDIFPIIFMVEKCAHFDIGNKKLFSNKGFPYKFVHFSSIDLANHGGPFEIFEKSFYTKYQNVHIFHHKNVGGNVWQWHQK